MSQKISDTLEGNNLNKPKRGRPKKVSAVQSDNIISKDHISQKSSKKVINKEEKSVCNSTNINDDEIKKYKKDAYQNTDLSNETEEERQINIVLAKTEDELRTQAHLNQKKSKVFKKMPIVITIMIVITGIILISRASYLHQRQKIAQENAQFTSIMSETRTPIDNPYLIKGFDEYDDKYKTFIDKNKKNFIRWTAHVKKVNDSKNLTLKEDGYPEINATFNYNLKIHHNIKEGDIITITGNPIKYDTHIFVSSEWYLENCRIEQTQDEEKTMVLNFKTIFKEQDEKAEREVEQKAISEKEVKNQEKWTKDNIVNKLKEAGVLADKGVFTDDTFGLGARKNDDSDGKTNIQNSYTLVLTVVPKNSKLESVDDLKELTFNIVKEIYNNKKKVDFNISLLELHYNNKPSTNGYANGDNFFIGINTINNYFKEPRANKVGIDAVTGEISNHDFDGDSFYKWIEDNFTSPEDNSILVENESWTTTSEKGDPNYGWTKASGNIYIGIKLYYGGNENKKYFGTVLQVNDKFFDLQTGKKVRAVQLELANGDTEWVNRNDIILNEYYIKQDDIKLK